MPLLKKQPNTIVDGFTHIKNEKVRAGLCALREVRLMLTWLSIAVVGLVAPELVKWLIAKI